MDCISSVEEVIASEVHRFVELQHRNQKVSYHLDQRWRAVGNRGKSNFIFARRLEVG